MNKYEREPETEIDLHGYTTMEAKSILADLIKDREYNHVRVIVGKGNNSAEGPVLKNFVKNYLREENIHFTQAKRQAGGEGALEVFL